MNKCIKIEKEVVKCKKNEYQASSSSSNNSTTVVQPNNSKTWKCSGTYIPGGRALRYPERDQKWPKTTFCLWMREKLVKKVHWKNRQLCKFSKNRYIQCVWNIVVLVKHRKKCVSIRTHMYTRYIHDVWWCYYLLTYVSTNNKKKLRVYVINMWEKIICVCMTV